MKLVDPPSHEITFPRTGHEEEAHGADPGAEGPRPGAGVLLRGREEEVPLQAGELPAGAEEEPGDGPGVQGAHAGQR